MYDVHILHLLKSVFTTACLEAAKLEAWSYSLKAETTVAVFDENNNIVAFYVNGQERA